MPANPYYARTRGNISSGGVSVPSGGYGRGGEWGAIANLFSTAIGAATYDEEKDPRAQMARKYGLEADNLADERAGRGTIANFFSSVDLSDPASVASTVRGIATEVAARGGNPDSVTDLFRFITANTPGTSEDAVGRSVVGAGGPGRSADTAYTLAGQTDIRRDNERVGDERNTADNVAAGQRNDATIAGAMERAVLEEGGRNTRADLDRASREKMDGDKPIIAPAGSTAITAPGDRRTVQTTVPGGTASKPNDVSPADVKTLEELVLRSLPEGADVEEGVVNSIIERASELYQETRNAGTAVKQAMQERANIAPAEDRFDFGTGLRDQPASVTGKAADPLGIR